jgi:hypothetical protein
VRALLAREMKEVVVSVREIVDFELDGDACELVYVVGGTT